MRIHLLDIKTFYFIEKERVELIALKETDKLKKYINMDNLIIEDLHVIDFRLHQKLQKMTQRLKGKYWEVISTFNVIGRADQPASRTPSSRTTCGGWRASSASRWGRTRRSSRRSPRRASRMCAT